MPLSKRDPANLFDMLEASEKVQLSLRKTSRIFKTSVPKPGLEERFKIIAQRNVLIII